MIYTFCLCCRSAQGHGAGSLIRCLPERGRIKYLVDFKPLGTTRYVPV